MDDLVEVITEEDGRRWLQAKHYQRQAELYNKQYGGLGTSTAVASGVVSGVGQFAAIGLVFAGLLAIFG